MGAPGGQRGALDPWPPGALAVSLPAHFGGFQIRRREQILNFEVAVGTFQKVFEETFRKAFSKTFWKVFENLRKGSYCEFEIQNGPSQKVFVVPQLAPRRPRAEPAVFLRAATRLVCPTKTKTF